MMIATLSLNLTDISEIFVWFEVSERSGFDQLLFVWSNDRRCVEKCQGGKTSFDGATRNCVRGGKPRQSLLRATVVPKGALDADTLYHLGILRCGIRHERRVMH
ncbi:hypothetical protein [Caballeronia sp. LZ001]|uniref:hypothetical protein n=1 Tax=Caballeronia sp. LZ001 TaxID=3038553 RepID=UPI002855A5DE|nr:hypothetical protein [Caballeronia sp. LZ001]MDR5802934.1 hypothetical protein [Caballeronia sp. LZ001]